jgi:paraquat-inducible protein B
MPRLMAGQISGLDTLISGSYIELLPGVAGGRAATAFTGLETPPVLTSNMPGRTFLLHADRVGSVSVGSPVFFRDLDVGQVLGWDVGKALLLGGVAFDTLPEALATPVSAADQAFTLYADKEAANNASFHRRVAVVSYFPGSVAGLAPGSPVTFQGLRLGEVTGVAMVYDPAADTIRTPVRYEIEPERVQNAEVAQKRGPLENARFLVAHGLRARIKSTNLVTGQSEIAFDFFPNAMPASIATEDNAIILPAVAGEFADIGRSASALLSQVNQLPFQQIGNNLNTLLTGANALMSSPELKQTLQSMAAYS